MQSDPYLDLSEPEYNAAQRGVFWLAGWVAGRPRRGRIQLIRRPAAELLHIPPGR